MAKDDDKTKSEEDTEPDEDLDEDEDDDDDDDDESGGKRKKLLLFGGGAVALLAIVGAIVYFVFLQGDKTHDIPVPEPPVSMLLPSIVADLKTGKCSGNFLKLELRLEISGPENKEAFDQNKDLIIEAIRMHLRTLERQDLVGREGAERLRQDIIMIVNHQLAPRRVVNVLFKDFLLQ